MELFWRKTTQFERNKIIENIILFLSNNEYLKELDENIAQNVEFTFRVKRNCGKDPILNIPSRERVLIDSEIIEGIIGAVKKAAPRIVVKPKPVKSGILDTR